DRPAQHFAVEHRPGGAGQQRAAGERSEPGDPRDEAARAVREARQQQRRRERQRREQRTQRRCRGRAHRAAVRRAGCRMVIATSVTIVIGRTNDSITLEYAASASCCWAASTTYAA